MRRSLSRVVDLELSMLVGTMELGKLTNNPMPAMRMKGICTQNRGRYTRRVSAP